MPGSRRVRARPLTSFLASTEEKRTEEPQVKAQQPEVEVGAKAQVESWPCEELVKDRVLLARAVARYLDKYWSVGTIRLTMDVLGPCVDKLGGPLDAYYSVVRPVLVTLSKAGRIELIEDLVVNLVRGGANGSE